jgi:2-dehydropantoate 2-reductase
LAASYAAFALNQKRVAKSEQGGTMKIVVIGAGAMGGSYGGLLADAGHDVSLIDTWDEHVAAINRDGLLVDGALGEHRVKLPATTAPVDGQTADMAIIFTDSNNTEAAAATAAQVLGPDDFAITFQNGIGNVEKVQAVLGKDRVLGGSSMCSAATRGPGHVCLTHLRGTSVGEIDGGESNRTQAVVSVLEDAGFGAKTSSDIMGTIWEKFVVNCGGNAVSAVTGLRSAEAARVPEVAAFKDHVLDEVMAVLDAKGIKLPNPDIAAQIKVGSRKSFNKPSMLQHVLRGRQTEIDALNGIVVRDAKDLGIPTPYNESLVALVKGRELAQMRAIHEPDLDYDAWETRVVAGEED